MPPHDDDEWADYDDASDAEGLVHPLPKAPKAKRSGGVDTCDKTTQRPRIQSVGSATSVSGDESTESDGAELENTRVTRTYPSEVARLHARRLDCARPTFTDDVAPPPTPVTREIVDIGVEASIEAQKRVRAYHRRMTKREEQEKQTKERSMQAVKQTRAMYKAFNREIGVADIAPDVRYKQAVSAKRKEKKLKEQAASDETAARWYRKVTRQTRSEYNAADFGAKILDAARRDHHAKLCENERHRRVINKKLQQLSLQAKRIVTHSVGCYERGSYLLKVPPAAAVAKATRSESDEQTDS